MESVIKYYERFRKIGVIGNYLPRRCGIATFTTDLVEALSKETPGINCFAVAMNDKPEGYAYPDNVEFEISQNKLTDYHDAAEFLNINQVDIVCVQHEYGIFGGPAGSHLLRLLGDLRMPIVTTLHTVLKDSSPDYREVMLSLVDLSDKLIVMSQKACHMLKEVYGVPENKIAFVHHGIPDMPFVDPNFYKDQFDVEGKKVLLTFGLLSPNKGIETMLNALPSVIKKHPDVAYIILGATHPHILKTHGEEYRISLQQLARKLGISNNVIFHNRFVELKELCEYLGTADLYITPYLEEDQMTSGTLIYALGTGKAVISTPYWYATEMLAEGRGRLVPFKDSAAMAEQVIDLLDNDMVRHTMRKKAYNFCRDAVWKEVSRRYLEVFTEIKLNRARYPRPRYLNNKSIKSITQFDLPELKLDHLQTLSDDTGILQHAVHTIPDRFYGYCVDDNARALLVTAMGCKLTTIGGVNLDSLCNQYLGFLFYAFNREKGRFRNFMTYARTWTEEIGSEDAHGRAMWGLGKSVSFITNIGQFELSTKLFKQALKASEHLKSPRAIAFSLIGMHAYLQKFSGDSDTRRIREILADRLFNQFKNNATEEWPWFENIVTYANAKLPHAMLLSGQWTQHTEMIEVGLKSLTWLMKIQTEEGHFAPIGNNGWYEKGGRKARFDQQPIDANAIIEACIEAFNVTQDKLWIDHAVIAFNWFLGHNDLNVSLYDPKTGGCRDGLTADGVNQNEGAESSLAWLLSHMSLQQLYTDEILHLKSSKLQMNTLKVK